jgi:hypothetical protein
VPLDRGRRLPHDRLVVPTSAAVLFVIGASACGKAPSEPPASIVDLSTSTAELARDFDARRGEPRFLALLSPA